MAPAGFTVATRAEPDELVVECRSCGREQVVPDRMVSRHVCPCGGRSFAWPDTSVIAGHYTPRQREARERAAKAWGA